VASVADQHYVASGLVVALCRVVDLVDQGAGGIEEEHAAVAGFGDHGARNAMCGKDDWGILRHLVELVDENRASAFEVGDDPRVVHDLVAHVDRAAKPLERPFDDKDCAVDASAKATRTGHQNGKGRC
jgi:hypothetical protein